jgi:hypothetical protein
VKEEEAMPIPTPRTHRYYVGLDLGQTTDYTALCVLERPVLTTAVEPDPAYALRHLQRFPLGTPYPEIVRDVIALLKTPPMPGSFLVVDQTGVGRPVVDLFREAFDGNVTCRFAPITISAGHEVSRGNGGFIVPKKELISSVQVVLQTRRLQIASSLPDADVLVREMEHFKVKISNAGHESFESWRQGVHDDLVLAVALAMWVAEKALDGERKAIREWERGNPPNRRW